MPYRAPVADFRFLFFSDGYAAIAEGGWIGMSASPEVGGMGLPMTLTTAVNEMMSAACLSLQLNPLMTQGQIEAWRVAVQGCAEWRWFIRRVRAEDLHLLGG